MDRQHEVHGRSARYRQSGGMAHARLDMVGLPAGVRKTPQGGLEIKARLTRTGVLSYLRADGSIVRELRHPDDVYKEESLSTLRGAPLTVGHPGMVSPDNWEKHTVGTVADDVRKDGRFVAATTRVQKRDAVDGVESGDLVELSCGYSCDLVEQTGEYEGEKYDARQTNIVYNHVGLGPKGWGRAGSEVSLRLDGGAYSVGMFRTDSADAATPPVVNVTITDQREIDRLKGENDTLRADNAELRQKTSQPAIDALVQARFDLLDSARRVLGTDANLVGKSDIEIMSSVIAKAKPSIKLDGKSEDYVRGVFETAVAGHVEEQNTRVREDAGGAKPVVDTLDAARARMLERHKNASKVGAK